MNTATIKQHLLEQIDLIEDENQLQVLDDVATDYANKNKFVLTKEQEERLQESIQQANEGKVISHEEVMKKAQQWRTK